MRYICYAAVHLLRSGTSGPASSDAAVPRRAAAQFGAAHVVGVPGWMAWMRGGGWGGAGGGRRRGSGQVETPCVDRPHEE